MVMMPNADKTKERLMAQLQGIDDLAQLQQIEAAIAEILGPAYAQDSLPPAALQALERGLADIEAGRVFSKADGLNALQRGIEKAKAEISENTKNV